MSRHFRALQVMGRNVGRRRRREEGGKRRRRIGRREKGEGYCRCRDSNLLV